MINHWELSNIYMRGWSVECVGGDGFVNIKGQLRQCYKLYQYHSYDCFYMHIECTSYMLCTNNEHKNSFHTVNLIGFLIYDLDKNRWSIGNCSLIVIASYICDNCAIL